MAKARSPHYPAIGLGTAIEKITAVYQKDAQNSIPRSVVARHAGYNGITGQSLSMLSSLLKYGLLVGRADKSSVSDLAMQIIAHPQGTAERQAAIREAAFNPKLFAEIRDHYKGAKHSDEALRAYLLTRKFLPSAVDGVIRAYRETMTLVDAESVGYPVSGEAHKPVGTGEPPVPPSTQSGGATAHRQHSTIWQPSSGAEPFRVTFTGNGIEIAGRITDADSADDLVRAVNALKLLLKPIGEAKRPEKEDNKNEASNL